MNPAPKRSENHPKRTKRTPDEKHFSTDNEVNIKIHSSVAHKTETINNRNKLVADSIVGFIGFFAAIAVLQATINVFRPEPAITPAIIALVLVLATVAAVRWRNNL